MSIEEDIIFRTRRRKSATPTQFGQERAEEIWSKRGLQNIVDYNDVMTDGEVSYVHQIWDMMPGYTCWMDAFHRIRLGKIEQEKK